MTTTYRKEITSVFEGGVCLGFIARRSVVFGVCDVDNLWCCTPGLNEPWRGAFANRAEVSALLRSIFNARFRVGK